MRYVIVDLEATCWAITILLDRAWQIEPLPGTVLPETLTRAHHALAGGGASRIWVPGR